MVAPEGLGIATVIRVVRFSAVTDSAEAQLLAPPAGGDQAALGIPGMLRDYVDDPVDRVGAPHGRSRTTDHLNPVDIVQQSVLHIPGNPTECRRVDASAIHQHQELVGPPPVETANANGPLVGVDAGHLDAGCQAQRFRNAGGAGAADIFLRDHVDGRGHLGQPLLLLRDRSHLDLHQFLDAEICQGRRLWRYLTVDPQGEERHAEKNRKKTPRHNREHRHLSCKAIGRRSARLK